MLLFFLDANFDVLVTINIKQLELNFALKQKSLAFYNPHHQLVMTSKHLPNELKTLTFIFHIERDTKFQFHNEIEHL